MSLVGIIAAVLSLQLVAPVASSLDPTTHGESPANGLRFGLVIEDAALEPHGRCPSSLVPGLDRPAALVFVDEQSFTGRIRLVVQPLNRGDLVDSGRPPLPLDLATLVWTPRVELRLETVDGPAAVVRDSVAIATGDVRDSSGDTPGLPQAATFAIGALAPGTYRLAASVVIPLAGERYPLRVTADPYWIVVRAGAEDDLTQQIYQGRVARRALRRGDFTRFEAILLVQLDAAPSAGGWAMLASESLNRVPLETTAQYFERARRSLEVEYQERLAPEFRGRAFHQVEYMRRLSALQVVDRLLPMLRQDPQLRLEVASPFPDLAFRLSGPGLELHLATASDDVVAKLRSRSGISK